MASQGPNSPGTATSDSSNGGSFSWSNPNNCFTNNGFTTDIPNFTETSLSHYLKATNFGFTIPTGAAIDGIVVEIEKYFVDNGTTGSVSDGGVYLVRGGSVSGNNKANEAAGGWSTTEAYVQYSTSSDTWGLTGLTHTEINASNFGVVISAYVDVADVSVFVLIDHIRITVYYTAAAVVFRQRRSFNQAVYRASRW